MATDETAAAPNAAPRGPKFRRRADARPDEVLDAALDLFIEKGFATTRVEDIAKRAGISKGAVVPWAKSQPPSPYYMQVLSSLARAYDFALDVPWKDLPAEAQDVVLRGTGGKPVVLRFMDGRKSYEVKKPFEGVLGNLQRRFNQTESAWMREELSRYQGSRPCEVCNGLRLKPEALSVRIAGENISSASQRSVADARDWFATLHEQLTDQQNAIAKAIL